MTVSRDDPRICRTPWPFAHLTLGGVIECERLTKAFAQRSGVGRDERKRLSELLRRRYRPIYADRGQVVA